MADGSITDIQAHIWLQEIADNGWISLHYDNPGLGSSDAAEISGGGYLRFKMVWRQPDNRTIWSQVDARFSGLTQNKIVYFGVWDSQYKGMLRAYAQLATPELVLNGRGFVLNAGSIAISIG